MASEIPPQWDTSPLRSGLLCHTCGSLEIYSQHPRSHTVKHSTHHHNLCTCNSSVQFIRQHAHNLMHSRALTGYPNKGGLRTWHQMRSPLRDRWRGLASLRMQLLGTNQKDNTHKHKTHHLRTSLQAAHNYYHRLSPQ